MNGRIGIALAAVTWVAFVSQASADVATEAGFFDALARSAYAKGRYEVALESFQLVQEIAPSQGTLYNIALCADLAERSDMAFSLYREYLQSDDPDAGRRADATRRLEVLARKLALVAIESEPAGAAVYVDRKELGRFAVTPATIALPEGEHRLIVEREGAVTAHPTVAARKGTLETIRVVLAPRFGGLAVALAPASATLRLERDGIAVAATPEPDGRFRLPAGVYRIVATAPGHEPTQAQVAVRPDAEARLDLVLVPLARETGRLLVSTGGVEAEVFVNGRRAAVAPAALSDIGPGEHVVEVRSGPKRVQRKVTVRTGRATLVTIDLEGSAP